MDTLNPHAQVFVPHSPEKGTSPQTATTTESPLFEIQLHPTKGFGVFATQPIPIGTCIVLEQPLLRVARSTFHKAWEHYSKLSAPDKATFDALNNQATSHLPLREMAEHYKSQTGKWGPSSKAFHTPTEEHMRVMSILSCNNFQLPNSDLAVFPIASRLNHSCLPNVHPSFNNRSKQHIICAVRDIVPGEELCNNYLGIGASVRLRADRNEILHRCYGFICTCAACEPTNMASDARRAHVRRMTWALQQYASGVVDNPYVPQDAVAALRYNEELIALSIDEGLISVELAGAYRGAATQARDAGMYQKALEYAYNEMEVEENMCGAEVKDLHDFGMDTATWIRYLLMLVTHFDTETAAGKEKAAVMSLPGDKKERKKGYKKKQNKRLTKAQMKAKKEAEGQEQGADGKST